MTRAAGSVRILLDIEGFVPDERNGLIAAYELLVLPGHAGLIHRLIDHRPKRGSQPIGGFVLEILCRGRSAA